MTFRSITTMDIYEIIRRWHSKQAIIHIAQGLGYDPKTVRKYIQMAKAKGIAANKPLPEKDEVVGLHSSQSKSNKSFQSFSIENFTALEFLEEGRA